MLEYLLERLDVYSIDEVPQVRLRVSSRFFALHGL